MFRRPTGRRRGKQETVNLNLVPMLDTLVTLIGFLLYTMSFLSLVSIDSPFPQVNASEMPEKMDQKPLQLTLTVRDEGVEIWSPFDRIAPKKIANTPEGTPELRQIHGTLIEIKKQYPTETKIVFVPSASTNYDSMISIMDSMRMLEATDPTLYVKNPTTGIEEPTKLLFPDVVFGNLLGDS